VFNSYQQMLVRCGSKVRTGKKTLDSFFVEFDTHHAAKLCSTHLSILLKRKEQFVGIKTLNSALRFVAIALKTKKMREACGHHINTILFELTLPLLLVTEKETQLW
jgi:hypothetical protein